MEMCEIAFPKLSPSSLGGGAQLNISELQLGKKMNSRAALCGEICTSDFTIKVLQEYERVCFFFFKKA